MSVLGLTVALVLTACGGATEPPMTPEDGGDTDGYTATIPEDWPQDLPLPAGMDLEAAGKLPGVPDGGTTWSASYSGETDAALVNTDLMRQFQDNGFTADTSFGAGPDGGISSWKKGTMTCQLTIANEGGRSVVNITAIDQPGVQQPTS